MASRKQLGWVVIGVYSLQLGQGTYPMLGNFQNVDANF
jgi:hypothetical protein